MTRARQHLVAAVRTVDRAVRAVLHDVRHPPYAVPGHFYSPRSGKADVERAIITRRKPVGVELHEQEQLDLAGKLQLGVPPLMRWVPNGMYGELDAAVLRAMLLELRPAHFFEVGSGFSTGLALDVADEVLPDLRITCVEPYPKRLLSRLRPGDRDRITLVQSPLQELEPEDVAAQVQPGDVLFIDSTHVVKAASDVVWLMLYTLPLLRPGVTVHIHDIHWPFEYPDSWLRQGRDWNEVYLVHAFLAHNANWQILLFSDWLRHEHPEALPQELRGISSGSLWIRRVH